MLLVIGAGNPAKAVFELDLMGPRSAALGGAGAALPGDVWAMSRNPAQGWSADPEMGLCWSQLFGLPELSRECVAVIVPVHLQAIMVRGGNLGTELYRETEFSIGAGRRVLSQLSVGIEIAGHWLHVREYNNGSAIGGTIGVLVEPHSDVTVGAVWRNVNRPRLSGYTDRIDDALVVGTSIRVGDEGTVVFDVIQEPRYRAEYRMGAEARVHQNIVLQVGTRLEPVRPSAGMQILAGRWSFQYAGDLHPDLGASHELGLSVRLRR